MSIDRQYLTVAMAAEYLGTGERFVRRLVAERRVVFYKVGSHVRFTVADLEAFVQEGRIEPVEVRWSAGKAVA